MSRGKLPSVCVLFYACVLLLTESVTCLPSIKTLHLFNLVECEYLQSIDYLSPLFPIPAVVSTTTIECIPLKLCPLAVNLIKTKPYAPETIGFLRYSHCGFDGSEAKIWCTLFRHCKTPDSRNGVCKNINQCSSFLHYMKEMNGEDPVVRKYLKEFRCSTEHDPQIRVCCPYGKVAHPSTTTERTTTATIERFSGQLPDPNLAKCGRQSSENKIVGGAVTSLDEFPWMALLKYVKGDKVEFACAGALINDQYVLTAGHCVDPFIIKSKNLGKLQSIILGEYDTRNETDCIYQKYGADCADPPQLVSIQKYIIHPNYNSTIMSNDIAIIHLTHKARFSEYVQPICLPSLGFKLQGDEKFTISGWGRTETERRSPVKRKTQVSFTDQKICNKYNGARKISSRQICVGRGGGVDSCYGDSGGPLMLQKQTSRGLGFFAVGIVSYGYGQICGSFPGVYTYIPPFLDWIIEQIV